MEDKGATSKAKYLSSQTATSLLFFSNLLYEATASEKCEITAHAQNLLHCVMESLAAELISTSGYVAAKKARTKIKPEDIKLVLGIRGLGHLVGVKLHEYHLIFV